MLAFDPEPKHTTDRMEISPIIERGECTISEESIIIVDHLLTKESCASLRKWIDNDENKELIYTRWSEKNADKKKLCRYWNFPIDINEFIYDVNNNDKEYETYINPCWRFVKNFPNSCLSYHFDGKYIKSVDCMSKYTIMIYLSDHLEDGKLEIKNGKETKFIDPKEGRLVIFSQDLLHRAHPSIFPKYFIRSEIMSKRICPIESENDRMAIKLFEEAILCYYSDPERSANLEKEAYHLSPLLENIVL
jgi:hypothetical protein